METISAITAIVCIVFVIIQIMMIVKFFQIASDTRDIRDLLNTKPKDNCIEYSEKNKPIQILEVPDFEEKNETIIFSDGKRGDVIIKFGSYGFQTKSGRWDYSGTKEEAIKKLYYDLSQ
jgi:hypothetical protein